MKIYTLLTFFFNANVAQWILNLLLFVYVYFAATYTAMIAIGVFITIDAITAIWRAKHNGLPVTSKKFRNTIGKGAAYMIAIIVAHIFELHFTPGLVPMMKIVAFYIASAELKSIFENLGAITGLDIWTLIKERLAGIHGNKDETKS